MSTIKYKSNQLKPLLESFFKKKENGTLSLKIQVNSGTRPVDCLFILRNGALVFGDKKISQPPTNKEFCQMLGNKLKHDYFKPALSVAIEKITNPTSVRELVELMIAMKIFTWQEVEAFVINKVVLVLEQFSSDPGEATWQVTNDFDLSYEQDKHSLSWSGIQKQLYLRQQRWNAYAPTIPSMEGIPLVTSQQLTKIKDLQVKKHLATNANGKQTLIDIAEKMGKDPLKVAKNYFNWSNNDWVSFNTISEASHAVIETKEKIKSIQIGIQSAQNNAPPTQSQDSHNLPIVLSVDDSPIIQTTIKRALQEQYNVLLAGKATEAIQILNQKPVKLLLLDLTMPDIDGLDFCKTIRKIPKFHDLPIIMVTARDGLVNKMKGHVAGTSKYLTKPFKPEELREVVKQYIKTT